MSTVQISLNTIRAKRDAAPKGSRLRAAYDLYLEYLEVASVARYLERHTDCRLLRLEQFVSWDCCDKHRTLQKRSEAARAKGESLLPANRSTGSVFSFVWWQRLGIALPNPIKHDFEVVE